MDGSKLPPPNPSTPLSPEDEVAQLRDVVQRLAARVYALEQRSAETPQAAVAVPPTLPSPPKTETRVGLTFVNRAGALTLAIGIIFFFKYAVDNRWIGAVGRVWIGVTVGALLLGAAEWFRGADIRAGGRAPGSRVFTQGLAGCGLATIYAAVYAAFAYYELIVPIAGWTLLGLVSASAVFLSIRYNSLAIAALGFAGGLLTPLLLQNKLMAWWFHLVYLLLLSGTALVIATRQRWPALIPWMAGGTLLAAAVSFDSSHPVWFALFACLLAAAHFTVAAREQNPDESPRLANAAWFTAHGALLIGAMRAVAIWIDHTSVTRADRYSLTSALESVLLALYGIVALTYGIARNAASSRTLGLILLGTVIGKLYLWDIWQLNRFYRITAFVALGILLLAASYVYSRFRSADSSERR